jgi:uncharacterized protein YndB with AHSA1/START domain
LAKAELSVTIDRPIDEVFRVLSTPDLTPKWSPSAIEEHLTTPGPVRIGSRRHATVRAPGGRTMENDAEVTAFEPNRRMAMKSIAGAIDFSVEWTFHEVADGTRVDWVWDFQPRGLLWFIGGPLAATFRRMFRKDLDRLKAMMEAGQL